MSPYTHPPPAAGWVEPSFASKLADELHDRLADNVQTGRRELVEPAGEGVAGVAPVDQVDCGVASLDRRRGPRGPVVGADEAPAGLASVS